jgi:hypothetical protein
VGVIVAVADGAGVGVGVADPAGVGVAVVSGVGVAVGRTIGAVGVEVPLHAVSPATAYATANKNRVGRIWFLLRPEPIQSF